jgi:hypothetical protein
MWEWRAVAGGASVRPSPLTQVPAYIGASPIYIAATEFTTFGGRRYLGYCSPADPQESLDYTQPVILTASGPLALWNERENRLAVEDMVKTLGVPLSELFPMQLKCLVASAEGPYAALIAGA